MLELCCSNMAGNFRLEFGLVLVFKGVVPLNRLPYQIKRYPDVRLCSDEIPLQLNVWDFFFYLGQYHTRVVLSKELYMVWKQTNAEFWCPLPMGFCVLSGLFKKWQLSFRNKHTEHFLAGNCDTGQNPINRYNHFD